MHTSAKFKGRAQLSKVTNGEHSISAVNDVNISLCTSRRCSFVQLCDIDKRIK